MKRVLLSLITACMLLSIFPSPLMAGNTNPKVLTAPANTPAATAEANILVARLHEIRAMDMTSLTKSDKKELRKEVRAIKSELKASNPGVYLSVGAIIIIILLLILIL